MLGLVTACKRLIDVYNVKSEEGGWNPTESCTPNCMGSLPGEMSHCDLQYLLHILLPSQRNI